MAIRIITDSSADYDLQELSDKNITMVPLSVSFGDDHYEDRVNITTDEFYQKLAESKAFPKTSQPSPAAFLEHFTRAKEGGDEVIAILISGVLSGTIQSAQIAKHMCDYDGIHIIDSKTVTAGLKLLVDKAAAMRDAGDSAGDIVGCIENLKARVCIRAAVDTLEYLYKGGRLTKLQAGLGMMAGIKPIVTVDNRGSVAVCGKVRGKSKACQNIIKSLKECDRNKEYPLYFLYSGENGNCLDLIDKVSAEGIDINNKTIVSIGPAIGTHVGGGAFGVAFVV
jgi:DegV family protein with EDD domain